MALALLFVGLGRAAAEPAADAKAAKTIYLIDETGGEHPIGSVDFGPADTGETAIAVTIDDTQFVEKFLSMRPFRCIDGTRQTVCHLPYPYALRDRISASDLTDLEYRLLFLHKGPTDYGIDAWNGHYYRISPTSDGGYEGALNEADFNVLAVPPEKEHARPIGIADLTPAEAGRHRFPRLSIR